MENNIALKWVLHLSKMHKTFLEITLWKNKSRKHKPNYQISYEDEVGSLHEAIDVQWQLGT